MQNLEIWFNNFYELNLINWFINLYELILVDKYTSAILIGSTLLFLILYKLLKEKEFLLFSIFLPATYFHELAHFVISFFLLGKPKKFSVLPQRTEKGWILGYVESHNLTWWNTAFVALAPLLLLPATLLFIEYSLREDVWFLLIFKAYICANLLLGMKPSRSDFQLALRRPIPIILIFCYFVYLYTTI